MGTLHGVRSTHIPGTYDEVLRTHTDSRHKTCSSCSSPPSALRNFKTAGLVWQAAESRPSLPVRVRSVVGQSGCFFVASSLVGLFDFCDLFCLIFLILELTNLYVFEQKKKNSGNHTKPAQEDDHRPLKTTDRPRRPPAKRRPSARVFIILRKSSYIL